MAIPTGLVVFASHQNSYPFHPGINEDFFNLAQFIEQPNFLMNVGHLSMNVGHLSMNVGHPSMNVGHLSMIVGHLSMIVGLRSINVGRFSMNVGHLSMNMNVAVHFTPPTALLFSPELYSGHSSN